MHIQHFSYFTHATIEATKIKIVWVQSRQLYIFCLEIMLHLFDVNFYGSKFAGNLKTPAKNDRYNIESFRNESRNLLKSFFGLLCHEKKKFSKLEKLPSQAKARNNLAKRNSAFAFYENFLCRLLDCGFSPVCCKRKEKKCNEQFA